MADITPVASQIAPGLTKILWTGLSTLSTGLPSTTQGRAGSMTIQMAGTWTNSFSLTAKGSNDGTNYSTLTTPTGGSISLTTNGIRVIAEAPIYMKIEGATGATDCLVDVTLIQRSW